MLHRLGEEYSQRPMKGHREYINPSGRQLLRRFSVIPPTGIGTPPKSFVHITVTNGGTFRTK